MDNALSVWQRMHRSRLYEIISAVLLTAVLVAGAYGEAHPGQVPDKRLGGHPIPHTPTAAYLLVIAAGLAWLAAPLPGPGPGFATACVAAYSLAGWVNGAALLLPVIALYCVTREWPAKRAVAAAGVTLVVLMGATALNNPFGPVGGGFDLIPGLIAAALFAGLAASNRRAYIETVKARAEEDAPPRGQRRTAAHRPRAARRGRAHDGHDQRAGRGGRARGGRAPGRGRRRADRDQDGQQGRPARAAGHPHVLRQADETDDGSPTQPAPGLAQLDGLVASTVAAGLATTVPARRQPPAAVPGRRPDRLPDHPGVPDERDPARRARPPPTFILITGIRFCGSRSPTPGAGNRPRGATWPVC